jgi:hypothetical protein
VRFALGGRLELDAFFLPAFSAIEKSRFEELSLANDLAAFITSSMFGFS